MGSNPTELDQVNRRVMQLEIEESALKNESDNASKHRLEELQEELSNEKKNKRLYNLVLNKRKKNCECTRKTSELDRSRQALEDAQTEGNLEKQRITIWYNTSIRKELKEFEEAYQDEQGDDERMIREVVSDEEIGDIVSQWTGIPVSKLVETERKIIKSK